MPVLWLVNCIALGVHTFPESEAVNKTLGEAFTVIYATLVFVLVLVLFDAVRVMV